MHVTLIGTGNTARGIGSRVLAGGHDLTVVGKDAQRAEGVACDIGGEGTVKTAAPGARFVKAFNTTFASPLTQGEVAGHTLDVLIAGDDDEAKPKVAALARDGGLKPIDVGPQARARELEATGLLHMGVQDTLGTSFASALKIIV